MTMLEQRIRQQFYDASDLLVQLSDELARPVSHAVELIVTAITAGGRILVAGSGSAQADAHHAAALLAGCGERARPALAALVLGADAPMVAALTQAAGDMAAGLARQVQALGQPGDVLVLFEGHLGALGPAQPNLGPLVEAAHAKDMSVVLWSGAVSASPAADATRQLTDTDVHVPVRADRMAHRSAVYRLGWHFVADAIDTQLMGELE